MSDFVMTIDDNDAPVDPTRPGAKGPSDARAKVEDKKAAEGGDEEMDGGAASFSSDEDSSEGSSDETESTAENNNFVFHGDESDEDEDWYIMGCSFGNRVATAVIAELDERQRVPPKLILTGYPMYGPSLNNKDARVRSLQSLPVGTPVLAISGTKDEFINSEKNVPDQLPSGNPRAVWDSVLQTMPCRATTTVRLIEKGGHGVYPAAKGRKATTTTQLVQYIDTFVNRGDNGDVPSRQSIRDADIEAYISKR